MNFEDQKTKVILAIVISILASGMFYYDSIKGSLKKDISGNKYLVNDDGSNLERIRKNKGKKNYARKVSDYTFEEYLNDQIPQESQEITEPIVEIVEEKVTEEKVSEVRIIYLKEKAPIKEEPKPVHRRTGFSSGKTTYSQKTSISNISIAEQEIKVAILKTQKVKAGDIVLLRTTERTYLEGKEIPVNTIIEGSIMFGRSRMDIKVEALQVNSESTVCNLYAFTATGNKGLTLNKDVNYEIKNSVTNDILTEASRTVTVPYLGTITQGATKKKVSDPTVTLKKGTKMYLRSIG